jgi:spermidine synthase
VVRVIALALTLLTGFSGLVYEVAWEKYLATLLGSHSEATAAILAIFLGGVSLGYSVFGRLTRVLADGSRTGRMPSLLFVYGLVEAAIGVWALAFPILFAAVQALSFAVPHGVGGAGFAFDVVLAALLIGPPTVLMGGTIPILTQSLARDLEDVTRFHAFVYTLNTAGAFAGALAGGFVLVPSLGLDSTLVAMGFVNLAAGIAFLLLGWRRPRAVAVAAVPHAAPPLKSFAPYALAAGLSGFAMMALQTVMNRLGGLSFGSSNFTFSMVVAVFVSCIALGSFAVTVFPRIHSS